MILLYLCFMKDCLLGEVRFRTSRSQGPGGQHVNKTESRVEIMWHPGESACLDDKQKLRVLKQLEKRLTEEGELILASEKYRSQYRNKEDVSERFLKLVAASLLVPKQRKPTRPTRSSKELRLKRKKMRGEIKKSRREGGSE